MPIRRCRLWRALLAAIAVFASPSTLWAGSSVFEDLADRRFAEFRSSAGGPEAIAPLFGLVQLDGFLSPGRLERMLRQVEDGRVGGPLDPLVEAQVAYLLSLEEDRRGAFSEAKERRKALGLLADWWVLGPFDAQGRGGFVRKFPVEDEGAAIDPSAQKVYQGKERSVSWRRGPAEAFVQGAFFVDAVLRPASDAVAFLLVNVNSLRDQWAALRVGSPGPVKAWLGGKEIWAKDVVRSASLDQDAAAVHLARGRNLLLLKTVVTRGPWRVFVRLTNPEGAALPDVTASTDWPTRPTLARGMGGRAPEVRDLGRILAARAERAKGEASAKAWLAYARFLALVMPADREVKAVEAALGKAIPSSPNRPSSAGVEALLLLGAIAREEDDRRAALNRALPELQDASERALALADLGRSWHHQQRGETALAYWRQAIAADPFCLPAQLALAREEDRVGMPWAALTRLSALPDPARILPAVASARADVFAGLGRRRESELLIGSVYNLRRSETAAILDYAAATRARGDTAGAGRLYGEAARWRPDLSSLVLDQAALLEGAGATLAGEMALRTLATRLPDDAAVYEELGRLQARMEKNQAAIVSMRRAIELRPQNPALRRYMESLVLASSPKRGAGVAEDLAKQFAADGEALAREVLFASANQDDAAAEVLLDRTVVKVHSNGLSERFVQRLVHLRSDRAARENKETWVRYEPGRQEVEIRKSRVLRRAGASALAISEATAREERDLSEPWYGLYYDSRAQIVAFENLRAGDVLEIQYTVADVGHANELSDYFGDFQLLADALPVRQWDYTLLAPAKRAFYFNEPRLPGLVRQVETRGEETRYHFLARDVPRVDSEPAMPGLAEVAPYLHVSTYRSWEDVGRWYWNLVADQMQDDGSLSRAAAQAAAGENTILAKVKAVHRLVVEGTRYVGLEFGIHGYKPYPATQVFLRRFGDCKDKATLLVTLLRSLGIDADLVLLRTRRGGTIESEPASLAVFDHAIAYVPTLDLYIDGTAEFSGIGELPAPDQDAMALRVSAHEVKLVRTPVQMAAANRTQRRWKVDLRQDGSAHIAEDVTVAGQSAHEWREHYQTPGERKERYAKVWNGRFAGAVLEEIAMDVGDRNQPALVHGLIHVPRMGEPRDQGEVHLPTSSREADYTRTYTRLGERHWPLLLGFPWRHEEVIRYVLPSRARVLRLPAARNIETPFGAYTMVVQTSPDGRELTFQSSLVVEKNRIEAFDYAAFRAFFRDIDAALAERLVVRLETTL